MENSRERLTEVPTATERLLGAVEDAVAAVSLGVRAVRAVVDLTVPGGGEQLMDEAMVKAGRKKLPRQGRPTLPAPDEKNTP
jgi:hypothetical protein